MPFPPDQPAFPDAATGPQGRLALQGVTLLAVEDSRFASDALRLMCQRSGARLRRADSLSAARAHLAVYRPDVALIDLGLPDGPGEDLIRDLARTTDPCAPVVLAMSGDATLRDAALLAGAVGFVEKPIPGLAAFQRVILAHLPDGDSRWAGGADPTPAADRLALRDDLAMAAAALRTAPGPAERAYLSGFLSGIARQTGDAPLGAASAALTQPGATIGPLTQLIDERLAGAPGFGAETADGPAQAGSA